MLVALIVLVLVLAFGILTVIYLPPRRDDMWSDLASAPYLVTFSVLGLLAPLVNLSVRRQSRLSTPGIVQTFVFWMCCSSLALSLLIMIGAFRVLTAFFSFYLLPFRNFLLIATAVASLIVAVVGAAIAKVHKVRTGIMDGLTAATVLTVIVTLGVRLNWVRENLRSDCGVEVESKYVGFKPPDIPVYSLDRLPHTLSSYQGRIVIVDFWATRCAPCRTSLPTLLEFSHTYPADKVVFLPIAIDSLLLSHENRDAWARISPLISQLRNENAAVWTDTSQLHTWSPYPLPSLYVLDKHGVVQCSMNGWWMEDRKINLDNSLLLRLKVEINRIQAQESF